MDLIVLPFHDWKKNESEGLRNRDGHLVSHFVKSPRVGKVLMVDRPISLPERLIKHRPLRCRSGREIARSGRAILSQIEEKLFVLDMAAPDLISPLVLQRDWWDAIFRRRWVHEAIGWAAQRIELSTSRRVLICWSPLATGVFGRVGEQIIHFDADDNWCEHPVMRDSRGWIRRGYESAIAQADVLTCNTESTGEFLATMGGKARVIRNGIDLESWDADKWREEAIPEDLASIPRPWIGYAGRLARRTDVKMIDALARRRPQWSFVMIGPMLDRAWHRPLMGRSNIHFLGDKHYDRLPGYLTHLDVACIFHHAEEVKNMNPLKLYEYLALGLPVATTPVAGVETFADWVTVAADAEAMERAIVDILERRQEDPSAYRKNRQAVLDSGHAWSTKAGQFLTAMEDALAQSGTD